MADTMTIGRLTQFGAETAPGVAPASGATKQVTDLTVKLDPNFGTTSIRGTGRRFDAAESPNGMEYTGGKLGGGLGYNSCVYPMSMVWGAVTPTTPSGGVNARQWQWTPGLTGSVPQKTFDIEQGDSNDAEQVLNAMLQAFGVDLTRTACTPDGTLLAKALTKADPTGSFTGMTTVGVSAVPIVQMLPKDWSAYMDDAASGIGVTKLLRCFHAGFQYADAFLPFFPINSSLSSFGGTADNPAVKTTAFLELMKDTVGEGLWKKARAGQRKYIRLAAISSRLVDNYFVSGTGTGTGGTITFTYKGVTSAPITFSGGWTASAIQTALQAMSTIGAGNVAVSGGPLPGTAITITMLGTLADDTSALTMTTTGVTGGTLPNTLTPTTVPYSCIIDMVGSVIKPGGDADNSGLRTRQWDFNIVEDPIWNTGQAFSVTVVNAISSL